MMALPARGHKILFSAGEGDNGQSAVKPAGWCRLAKRNKRYLGESMGTERRLTAEDAAKRRALQG
ncbi:hypothetical protein [Duffyella gerundensis]|uniref:hypothetical protein n=1 Tax=Duffyella gerundensis TaxID=1619313 RepID=UPI0021F73032|nr:hypothetical protein [Duffyella gerundensis]